MQAITATQIDQIFESMKNYEQANFGLKNGPEFPAVAQALLASEKFRTTIQMAAMMGILGAISLPKDKDELKGEGAMERMFADSPMRTVLADVFFAGFKIGLQSAEVSQLEALANVTTPAKQVAG